MSTDPTTFGHQAQTHAVAAECSNAISDARRLVMLPIDRIVTPAIPIRSRLPFDQQQALVDSVAVHGVLEPVLVRPTDDVASDTYELLAGQRRRCGAEAAGITHVPAIVIDCPEVAALEIGLIENIQREPLNPLDEARALARLRDTHNLSIREMAERLGVGRGWVQERLQLLALPEDLQNLVSGRPDTATHARELARVRDLSERLRLSELVANGEMSLAVLRSIVRDENSVKGVSDAEASSAGANVALSKVSKSASAEPKTISRPSESNVAGESYGQQTDEFAILMGDLRSLQRGLLAAKTRVSSGLESKFYAELEATANIILDLMTVMDSLES